MFLSVFVSVISHWDSNVPYTGDVMVALLVLPIQVVIALHILRIQVARLKVIPCKLLGTMLKSLESILKLLRRLLNSCLQRTGNFVDVIIIYVIR